MDTLTMQGVADLARVKRPVVTMWRSRFKESEHPFPEPLAGSDLLFRASDVTEWLAATEHGNNPEAQLEAALHSSAFNDLASDAEDASVLLLIQAILDEPLQSTDAGRALARLAETDAGQLITAEELNRALAKVDLVKAVDTLVEAAYTGSAVLDRVVAQFTEADGAWQADALTAHALHLLAQIIHELGMVDGRLIAPHGCGSLVLSQALLRAREPDEPARFVLPEGAQDTPEQRIAWRLIASERVDIEDPEADAISSRLALLQQQSVADPLAFFSQLEELVVGLGPQDIAVVIAPAKFLIDNLAVQRALASRRANVLAPTEHYTSPLRYVAALPKGLSRFGGRRRLAMWVFGPDNKHAGKSWTVFGDHTDTALNETNIAAITSDVVTAVAGGGALAQHAFLTSTMRETSVFVRQDQLRAAVRERDHVDGSERLARVWELDDSVLPVSVVLQSSSFEGRPRELSWSDAVPRLMQTISGYRVPAALFEYPVAPMVATIGPEELRTPGLIGARCVNRLQLAQALPNASFTMPGDVIYTTSGQPAAWVDEAGGHLVRYPARVLRIKHTETDFVELHPQVLARDIELQAKRERASWRFRTLPTDELRALSSAAAAITRRRRDLTKQLEHLTALEQELIDGLTAGTLSVAHDTNNEN